MRGPETIEKLYLDFDGFFASVMQGSLLDAEARSSIIIACSKEAKAAGCMPVPEARAVCPDLILVCSDLTCTAVLTRPC